MLSGIHEEADLAAGLARLVAAHPDLAAIADVAGPLPLRRQQADLAGLARIVTAQQVSVASAAAIFARLEALVAPFTADTLDGLADADLAGAGLSRPKIATLRAIASAIGAGLDLAGLAVMPGEEAHRRLVAIRGIGPWTADIFLLFCAGHPDVFPAGDLALQEAVRRTLGLEARPKPAELARIAARWAPERGTAARLFWAYYRAACGRGAGIAV
jgi:DNA-3-methyladenine glycosylase II